MEPKFELFECATLPEQLSCVEHISCSNLFTEECHWTAMDANLDVIAIGTDMGILIVYDRLLNCIVNRLTSKLSKYPITCIKIFKNRDLLIAFGNTMGFIVVIHYVSFQRNTNDRLQAFTLKGIHKDVITSMEWSTNGPSLFSADQSGNILQTDLDLYKNASKSVLLCVEDFPVVQLSYYESFLIISTLKKSFIFNLLDATDRKQIGKLERKKLDKYGALFFKRNNEVCVYASRQGLRLWKANFLDGNVALTYQLKEKTNSAENNFYILNKKNYKEFIYEKIGDSNNMDHNLGRLIKYDENHLVSFADNSIIIINIENGHVEICMAKLSGTVLSVSVVDKEIFVLLTWKEKDDHFPIIKFSNKKSNLDQLDRKISIKELTQKANVMKNELSTTFKQLGDGLKNVHEVAKSKIIDRLLAGKLEFQEIFDFKNSLDLENKLTSIILGKNLVCNNDIILVHDSVDTTEPLEAVQAINLEKTVDMKTNVIRNDKYDSSIATHVLPKKKKVPTATLR